MHQNSTPNFSEPQAQRPFHRLKEPANLLCTGPSGKYSWLWGPQSLCHNDSTLCKSGHGPFINNRARQRADKTLFTPAGHDNSQQDAAGPHQHLPKAALSLSRWAGSLRQGLGRRLSVPGLKPSKATAAGGRGPGCGHTGGCGVATFCHRPPQSALLPRTGRGSPGHLSHRGVTTGHAG